MKRNFGLYAFSVGLLLLVIQTLILIFDILNGSTFSQSVQFAVVEEITFGSFISDVWAALFGTGLLIVLYVRRLTKGPEAMLVLVGAMLWIIQILGMYDSAFPLDDFMFRYIVGILGTVFIISAGIFDAYLIKRGEAADTSRHED